MAGEEKLHVLVAEHNADYNTYDGIEVGAERIAHEVEETIEKLTKQGAHLDKISVVGYSLGGLVARYMVGLLDKDGVFDKLQPCNFTAFASPWIGVRSPSKGFGSAAWNAVAPRTLSVSGRQMFCIDSFRDTGRPLLAVMADPNSIFMHALRKFKNKTLYANTVSDRSVPYYTAAFTTTNPFVDLDVLDLHYITNQEEKCILDPENPVSLKSSSEAISQYDKLRSRSSKFAKNLPFYAIFTVLFPVAATYMLINGGYQTYKSAKRIQLHETGKAVVDSKKYRIALLEQAQALQDQTLERMAVSQTETYLPTPPPEPAQSVAAETKKSGADEFPSLALTPQQLEMIRNLDQLGFTKYRCHITKHRHTHAAIIVRYDNANFDQGRSVIRHWLDNFEV